jgi:hypothetical protein
MSRREVALESRPKSVLRELFAIDPRSLAAFRIAIGLFLLADLVVRVPDLTAMYTDEGMFSRTTIARHFSIWNWSFHFGSGSWWYQAVLFGLAAIFASLLVVGAATRLATVASWLMLVSLHNRVPHILSGADNLARLLLFWGMFLPLGGVWSADAWAAKRRGSQRAGGAVLSVASAAILLQMAFMYLFSAAFKSNADWFNGRALAGIFADGFFGTPAARTFLVFPGVLAVLTVVVLALEWLAPFFLFLPLRTGPVRVPVIGLLAGMHIGIGILLNVGLFSAVSLSGLLLFVPSFVWDQLAKRLGKATAGPGPLSRGAEGIPHGPVSWRSITASAICAVSLGYVLFANLNGLPGHMLPWTPVPRIEFLTVSCGLGQKWDMFAEAPSTNGWCVARATLTDGTQVDLLREGAPVDWSRPQDPGGIYPNTHWLKCFREMSFTDARGYQVFRQPVAEYLCREWNRSHAADKRIADFVLVLCAENRSHYGVGSSPATIRETLVHLDPERQGTPEDRG